MPVVRIHSLSKSYGHARVLDHCSLAVERGEVLVVCGPSGSGKSTLLRMINALEPFEHGRVEVDGIVLEPAGNGSLAVHGATLPALRARVGMVFQHFELFAHLSVMRNLTLAQTKVLGRSEDEAAERARRMLGRVGLAALADRHPTQLSGGQQQRVAIARALTMDPAVMLFDEPTSALDPETVGEVLAVMSELAAEGMTMLCVTHELGFARRVAHRVVFMDSGRILDDRPVAEFFASPPQCSERAQTFLQKILAH